MPKSKRLATAIEPTPAQRPAVLRFSSCARWLAARAELVDAVEPIVRVPVPVPPTEVTVAAVVPVQVGVSIPPVSGATEQVRLTVPM